MEYLVQLAMLCFAISIYYKFQELNPIIEQDGAFWVIRIDGEYFVDAVILASHPKNNLTLHSGRSAQYKYCRFTSKKEAELYFNHVCNYATEGKIAKISYGY